MQFSIIISNTKRSIEYLKQLESNNLIPKEIIYIDNMAKNKISKNLKKKLKNKVIKKFNNSCIDKKIEEYLLKLRTKYFIYSGYPGIIIKNKKLLIKKKIIHSHPGKLPFFKGSTTIYYSLLIKKKIFCSTLLLNYKIDSGPILHSREYPRPCKINEIDETYDNKIRAQNLIFVLKNLKILKEKKQSNQSIQPYYVIHPLLRSIVLNFR